MKMGDMIPAEMYSVIPAENGLILHTVIPAEITIMYSLIPAEKMIMHSLILA